MTETDRKIKALGYEVRVCDLMCNYIVYENKKMTKRLLSNGMMTKKYVAKFSRKRYHE